MNDLETRTLPRRRAPAPVLLVMAVALVLAGCGQDPAADAASEPVTVSEPAAGSEPAAAADEDEGEEGSGTDLDGLSEDEQVVALCDQFFDEVVAKAETGDLPGMLDAIDTWAANAKGTPIAKETRQVAKLMRRVAKGEVTPDSEQLTSASADFGVQCAMHGWQPAG